MIGLRNFSCECFISDSGSTKPKIWSKRAAQKHIIMVSSASTEASLTRDDVSENVIVG